MLSQVTWGSGVELNNGNYNYIIKDKLTNRIDVSFSVTRNSTISAKTGTAIATLPSSIRPTRNVILNCFSYLTTTGGAYVRYNTGEIVVWFVDQVPASKEIGVIGSWYI